MEKSDSDVKSGMTAIKLEMHGDIPPTFIFLDTMMEALVQTRVKAGEENDTLEVISGVSMLLCKLIAVHVKVGDEQGAIKSTEEAIGAILTRSFEEFKDERARLGQHLHQRPAKDYLGSENTRNKQHADLYIEVMKRAFGPGCAIMIGHHLTFEKDGDLATENEIPSADCMMFDHGVMGDVFGDRAVDIMQHLAATPTESRDAVLRQYLDCLTASEASEADSEMGLSLDGAIAPC